jgi:DNA-binding transcriptional ArsR family regulator
MADRQLSDPLFLAIAHPTRRAMLELLLERGEVRVDRIREHLQLSAAVASQHLRVLVEAQLTAVRREGRTFHYRLTPEPLLEAVSWMQSFERMWREQHRRLRDHLDAMAPPHRDDDRN